VSTVLIAGGAGDVGSMVSRELLARGHRVVVADALLFGGEALLDLLSNHDFS
jgi:nucleoside-diphosphate-sugar epimerase